MYSPIVFPFSLIDESIKDIEGKQLYLILVDIIGDGVDQGESDQTDHLGRFRPAINTGRWVHIGTSYSLHRQHTTEVLNILIILWYTQILPCEKIDFVTTLHSKNEYFC